MEIPTNILLDLLLGGNEFHTFDTANYPAERWVVAALEARPAEEQADFHLYICANGLTRLYKAKDWLLSADHRAELRAGLAPDHAALDEQLAKEKHAKARLIKAFGEIQGTKLYRDIMNNAMPGSDELKKKLGLL